MKWERQKEQERENGICVMKSFFSDFVTNDLIMLINTFNCANCEVLGLGDEEFRGHEDFCKFCAYIAMI